MHRISGRTHPQALQLQLAQPLIGIELVAVGLLLEAEVELLHHTLLLLHRACQVFALGLPPLPRPGASILVVAAAAAVHTGTDTGGVGMGEAALILGGAQLVAELLERVALAHHLWGR
jgi:hypothetical protein